MSKQTFLNYKNWLYAKLSIITLAFCFVFYFYDQPLGGRKGNTFAGIVFGILATIIIAYLTYFGMRKRSYRFSVGSLLGTLSAHVWLGLILIILVPLHSGFSFNFNIHTFTYFVMVAVVLSGVFGAVAYRVLPQSLASQRGQAKSSELISKLVELDSKILECAKTHEALKNYISKFDFSSKSYVNGINFLKNVPEIDQIKVTKLLANLPENLHTAGITAIDLIGEKRDLLKKLSDELKVNTLLKIWLYIHVPFTFLLLILLFAHIFSVLYYWT